MKIYLIYRERNDSYVTGLDKNYQPHFASGIENANIYYTKESAEQHVKNKEGLYDCRIVEASIWHNVVSVPTNQ